MTDNPLIRKWEEIHGKKQTPKVIKAENFKVEIKPKVQYELDLETLKKLQEIKNNPPSVATVPSATTKASTSIKSYDVNSVSDSFFQVVEKIKDGTAQVTSMNMEYDNIGGSFRAGQRITFEVYVYEF
jgi:cell fate regulator YaaT (PSP1 superfamily)